MAKRQATIDCIIATVLLAFAGCSTSGQTKATKVLMRINCGAPESYIDHADNFWSADQLTAPDAEWGAFGGMDVDRGHLSMVGTDSPEVYETERYNMEAYKFTVPNGKYTVRLHFVETYSGISGNGQRVFSVVVNGKTALKDFDPYKEAGGFQKPIVKTIKSIAVTGGKLVIGFTANIQYPEINGIEILSE